MTAAVPTGALSSYLSGAGLGASLIVAIGAQNAFVLRQGLKRGLSVSQQRLPPAPSAHARGASERGWGPASIDKG